MEKRTLHVALNVVDLERSVAFYRNLFGTEPAKRRPDYAKFELADPPLVLSLLPGGAHGRPGVAHLGLRVGEAVDLEGLRARVAGEETRDEGETVCCYARQDKLWVADPDGNDWELYQLLGDAEERGGETATACCPEGSCA